MTEPGRPVPFYSPKGGLILRLPREGMPVKGDEVVVGRKVYVVDAVTRHVENRHNTAGHVNLVPKPEA